MKVIPPIKDFSNTINANETPRVELLQRDVWILLQENWKLKEELAELKKKNARISFRNGDLKRVLKRYEEILKEDF